MVWVRVEQESLRWLALSFWIATTIFIFLTTIVWLLRRRWKRRKQEGKLSYRISIQPPPIRVTPVAYYHEMQTTANQN